MKTRHIARLLMTAALCCSATTLMAQNKLTLYLSDTTVSIYSVDSLYQGYADDGSRTQVVTSGDTSYVYPLEEIDSMTYRSSTIEINGVVRGMDATGMMVEALTDIRPMSSDTTFSLSVPASDHGLHWVMLIDQDSMPVMYYRGHMEEGQTIVIDSASTAMALLLMMPRMQLMAMDDEARLDSIARSSEYYGAMCELIGQSVAAGRTLLDDANDTIFAVLGEWVEDVENATEETGAVMASATQFWAGSYTMRVKGVGRIVNMSMWDLNPAYYGTVSDGDGNVLTNIRVPSRGSYGFRDLLKIASWDNYFGDEVTFDMQQGGEGAKYFDFSCKTLPAQIDFYTTAFVLPAFSVVLSLDNSDNSCISGLIQDVANDLIMYLVDAARVTSLNNLADFKEHMPDMLSIVGDRVTSVLTSFSEESCIPSLLGKKNRNWLNALGAGLKTYLKIYTVGKELINMAGRCLYFYREAPDTLSFCMEWGEGVYSSHACTQPTIRCTAGNGQQGEAGEWLSEPVTFSISSLDSDGERSERHLTLHVNVVSGNGEISEDEIDVVTNLVYDVQRQVEWKLGDNEDVPQKLTAWLTDHDQSRIVSDVIEVMAFFRQEDAEERIDSFKVANNRYVTFSRGNLQYQPSTDTWRFAEHQYDVIGEANMDLSNNDNSYSGWIDLFSWSTANMPTYVPTNNSMYDGGYNVFYDWGEHPISNGGNVGNMWRTPTFAEWIYVMSRRDNCNELYSYATVCDVHGMILLPDNWVMPNGLTFVPAEHNWTTNVYNEVQWDTMEAAGAIFLPAAGFRCRPNINSSQLDLIQLGNAGAYWSASGLLQYPTYGYTPSQNAYRLSFFGTIGHAPTTNQSVNCYYGQSVRLIRTL